ncbi:NOTCH1 [Branchiostoma lanceolatum]|uniref:NOTCH1 protein n=1 Tax=Branchiostoma lanceolatum TaxID=7740 RepID=A0A8J9W8L4_BRALA|nr:NOTCH1 [Branchiostoma lanceolatum]
MPSRQKDQGQTSNTGATPMQQSQTDWWRSLADAAASNPNPMYSAKAEKTEVSDSRLSPENQYDEDVSPHLPARKSHHLDIRAKEKAQIDEWNEESDRKYEDVDPHGERVLSSAQHLDMEDHVGARPEYSAESSTDASSKPADNDRDEDTDAPGFCHKVRDHAVELWNKMRSISIWRPMLGSGIIVIAVMFIAEVLSPGSLIPNRKGGKVIGEKLEKPGNPLWTTSYKENSSDVAYPTAHAPPLGTMWQTASYENTSVVVTMITLSSRAGWKSTEPQTDIAAMDETTPVTSTLLSTTGTGIADECIETPCQHGRCVNKDGGYKCTCSPGWTGQNCRKDINECMGNLCQHGRCVNKDGGYKCTCSPGWTGQNCQQDTNECTKTPCQHGRCVDKDGGYKCTCSPGWTGQNCDDAKPCPRGWSEYNNHCYTFVSDKVNWNTAKSRCRGQHARLASITSSGENDFVAGLISNGGYILLRRPLIGWKLFGGDVTNS